MEVDLDNLPTTAAEFEETYGTEPNIKEGEDEKALLAFAAKVEKDCSWNGLYLWVKAAIKEKQIKRASTNCDEDDDDDDEDDDDTQITKFNDLLHEPPSDRLFLKLDNLFTDATAISSEANLEQYIQLADYPISSDNSQVQDTYANNMEMILDVLYTADHPSLDVWDAAGAAKAVISIRRQRYAAKIAKLKTENKELKRKLSIYEQEEPTKKKANIEITE